MEPEAAPRVHLVNQEAAMNSNNQARPRVAALILHSPQRAVGIDELFHSLTRLPLDSKLLLTLHPLSRLPSGGLRPLKDIDQAALELLREGAKADLVAASVGDAVKLCIGATGVEDQHLAAPSRKSLQRPLRESSVVNDTAQVPCRPNHFFSSIVNMSSPSERHNHQRGSVTVGRRVFIPSFELSGT
jgi:hypothetical protein